MSHYQNDYALRITSDGSSIMRELMTFDEALKHANRASRRFTDLGYRFNRASNTYYKGDSIRKIEIITPDGSIISA